MKALSLSLLTIIPAAMLSSAFAASDAPLPTVSKVNLSRYMGTWQEVARLPMVFQRGCEQSSAEYTLRSDGAVDVVNRCQKNGKEKDVRGIAEVVDAQTNAVLEVRFKEWFSPLIPRQREGNYFIIWLANDYSAAAVGTPDRKCLWILARKQSLPNSVYTKILDHCRGLGFPVEKLIVEPEQVARQ